MRRPNFLLVTVIAVGAMLALPAGSITHIAKAGCRELPRGTNADHCHAGYNVGYVTACTSKTAKFGCGDGPLT
jgi:hypothetical protein